MLKYLKIGVSTLALSAFVLAPAVTVITADYAYAKNDNGNNGNGGGNKGGGNKGGNSGGNKGGGEAKGNGKSSDAKGKSKGAGKEHGFAASKSRNPNRGTVKGDLQKLGNSLKSGFGLFGKKDKAVAKNSQRAKSSKQVAAREKGPMHPSNLGKLNGAINSSPNAKAAHIANGQYLKASGPVSLAAALAVADYEFVVATEDFIKAEETVALAAALDEANEFLATDPPSEDALAEARDFLDNLPEDATDDDIAAAESIVNDAANRETAQDLVDNTEAPADEDVTAAQETVDAGPPTEDDILAAEDNVLAEYKGTLAEENEEQVLQAVRDSNPDRVAIEDAVERLDERTAEDGDQISDEEADSASLEEETSADQG